MSRSTHYILLFLISTLSFAQHEGSLRNSFSQIQKFMHARDIDSMAILGKNLIQSSLISDDSATLLNTYQQLGSSYFFVNEFDSSEKYHLLAAAGLESQENLKQAALTLKQLGINYQSNLQFEKSLNTNIKALDMFMEIGDSIDMSMICMQLSSLNRVQGNFGLSLEYANKGLKIARQIDDKPTIGLSLIQLGMYYLSIDSYDSALKFGNQSYNVFNENRIGFGKIDARQVIVESLIGLHQYENAEREAIEYFKMAKNSGNISSQSDARFLLGKIYLIRGKHNEAVEQLNEAIRYALRMNYTKKIMETSLLLSKAHNELGSPEDALGHLNKYVNLRDSTYSIEKSKEIEKLQAQYSLKGKQREIEQLQTVSELKDLKIQQARDRLILIALVSLATLIIIFLIYNRKLFKQKLKFVEEQERLQKNRFKAVIDAEEKERKRIAQELHDGLGQILSTARLSISSLDEDEQNQNVQHSLKLIDSAVDETRTISHNMMPNALVSIGLEAALRDLVRNINQAGSIKAHIEIDQLPVIEESTSVAIYRIVQETINNALKYANATAIKVKVEVNGEMIFTISDNGKGFDTSNIENSGGIGWKNIYSRAGLINGNVSVFSKLGEGTTVKITLPTHESIKTATG